jgi:hypothetical protein
MPSARATASGAGPASGPGLVGGWTCSCRCAGDGAVAEATTAPLVVTDGTVGA